MAGLRSSSFVRQEGEHDVEAVMEGMEEAESRCEAMGRVVGEIESIEEVADFELEPEEGAEEEEGDEEEEEKVIKYKFVVQCVGKKKAAPKKKTK